MEKNKHIHRPGISQEAWLRTVHNLNNHCMAVCRRKGTGAFISRHEMLGVLTEEVRELTDEIQQTGHNEQVIHELLDIAFTALWSIASIQEGCTDYGYTEPNPATAVSEENRHGHRR